MLRSIAKRIGQLLLNVGRDPPPHPGRQDGVDGLDRQHTAEQFNQRGRQVLRKRAVSSSTVLAGTVQLLGFDDVRKEVGARWPQVVDKVHAIASRVIAERLDPEDIFSRNDDDAYILCFASADSNEARRITADIAAKIKKQILAGVEGGDRIGVSEFVAEVDFAPALESDRPLSEILADSLREIRKEAEEAYQRHRTALLKEAEVFYRPLWHVAKREVDLYRSVLDEKTGKSSLNFLRSLSTSEEIQTAMAELDMLIFSRSVKELHRALQQGGKTYFLSMTLARDFDA